MAQQGDTDPHNLLMRAVARLLLLCLKALVAHHVTLRPQLQSPLSASGGGEAQPLLTALMKLTGVCEGQCSQPKHIRMVLGVAHGVGVQSLSGSRNCQH